MNQVFVYQAFDKNGIKIRGEILSENENEATRTLEKKGLLVAKITRKSESFLKRGISLAQVEESTSQLSTLLKNGLKIDRALQVLADTNSSSEIGVVWQQVIGSIKKGESLSDALRQREDVFSTLYLEMVLIGESTGRLPEVFERLAENLSFQIALKKRVIQASSYPVFIFFVCIAAIWAIFNFVVPSMSSVFDSMETIPGHAQFLIDASGFVRSYQMHMVVLLVCTCGIVSFMMRSKKYKDKLIQYFFNAPLVKTIIKKSDVIRFSTAMQLTLESGVSLSSSLMLSTKTVVDNNLKNRLLDAARHVTTGEGVAESLEKVKLLDDLSLSLLVVGEESGTLDNSFREISARARQTFEDWITKFTTLLEPALILFMGGIVGGVVVSMLLSIVSINNVSF